MDRNLIGKIIRDRYHIIEQIEVARTSITFLVKDRKCLNKLFVARYFEPKSKNFQALEDARHLFDTEVSILRQLANRDCIPEILDYFEDNQSFFIIQNLIQGHKLSKEIAQKNLFRQQEIIDFLTNALITLVAIQDKGVIHLNIKPENIIIRNSDGKVILVDFSSAIERTSQNSQESLPDKSQRIIGTEGYIPLEQIMGNPGFYSDLHALGIIAVQTLTGKLPRELATDRYGELVWQEHLSPKIQYNPRLLKIINKAICYRYQKRYQSAKDFLEDIQKVSKINDRVKDRGLLGFNYFRDRLKLPNNFFNSRIIKITLSLIIGIFSLFAVILMQKNPTSNYLLYQNKEYQLQVKYHEDWQIKKRDDFLIPGIIFLAPFESDRDPFQENVSILIENLVSEISLSEYTAKSIAEIKQFSDSTVTKTTKTTLGSHEARSIIYQGTDNNIIVKRMQIWTIHDNKVYTITYTAQPDRYEEFLPIARKMTASFDLVTD